MGGDDLDAKEVRGQAGSLADRLKEAEDLEEWRDLSRQLIPLMIAYWDVHPHSAMEMLEYCTMQLPVSLAHAFVRKVVLGWREKATYNPDAGGAADHCYLSALILSENFDLAEHPWVDRVLPYTLDKELNYSRFERMRDGARKEAIVRAIATSSGVANRKSVTGNW
jgi:hypothetical protein